MKPTKQRHLIPPVLLPAAALVSAFSAAFFGYLYMSLYWPYRDLFNEEGRYFDPRTLVVHHEQASLLVVPAIVSVISTFFFTWAWWVRPRRGRNVGTEP